MLANIQMCLHWCRAHLSYTLAAMLLVHISHMFFSVAMHHIRWGTVHNNLHRSCRDDQPHQHKQQPIAQGFGKLDTGFSLKTTNTQKHNLATPKILGDVTSLHHATQTSSYEIPSQYPVVLRVPLKIH